MKLIMGGRGSGRTTRLIIDSSKNGDTMKIGIHDHQDPVFSFIGIKHHIRKLSIYIFASSNVLQTTIPLFIHSFCSGVKAPFLLFNSIIRHLPADPKISRSGAPLNDFDARLAIYAGTPNPLRKRYP